MITGSNLLSAASCAVLSAASISWGRLERGRELAQVQLQGLVKSRPWVPAGWARPSFPGGCADPGTGALLVSLTWAHGFCRCQNV